MEVSCAATCQMDTSRDLRQGSCPSDQLGILLSSADHVLGIGRRQAATQGRPASTATFARKRISADASRSERLHGHRCGKLAMPSGTTTQFSGLINSMMVMLHFLQFLGLVMHTCMEGTVSNAGCRARRLE
mmetsp:Transcript_34256/g.80032  ORF Transcript_34256/g.80032 Transcript_34256/m.80032 type:complete len:131 (-) Transcript_34256:295-687(-)